LAGQQPEILLLWARADKDEVRRWDLSNHPGNRAKEHVVSFPSQKPAPSHHTTRHRCPRIERFESIDVNPGSYHHQLRMTIERLRPRLNGNGIRSLERPSPQELS
jgi:hypothetical protein